MSKLVVLRIIKIDVEMFKLRPHSSFLMHAALMPMVSNTRATIYVGTSDKVVMKCAKCTKVPFLQYVVISI